MANDEHVALLKQGVDAWNDWRKQNPDIRPDLSEADLRDWDLRIVDLSKACLIDTDLSMAVLSDAVFTGAICSSNTDLSGARLVRAKLSGVNLTGASLIDANLNMAILNRTRLVGARLVGTRFFKADLSRANLRGADLWAATLVDTDLTGADLTGARVHGVSAWRVIVDKKTKQQDLIITDVDEPTITVDNIEVAQFVYLMLNNQKLRDVIDTVTSKAVLILGRFTQERKPVLEALRKELRQRKYVPILFDFEKPRSRNTDETITLLARMARFVIADISDAKSVLQELRAIVPDLPSVPVQPIILAMQEEPGMFDFYRPFPWFLHVHRCMSSEHFGQLAWQFKRVSGSSGLKVQAAIAC
jgi:uncharacterized protein YjbI with pentapeptide repeats